MESPCAHWQLVRVLVLRFVSFYCHTSVFLDHITLHFSHKMVIEGTSYDITEMLRRYIERVFAAGCRLVDWLLNST